MLLLILILATTQPTALMTALNLTVCVNENATSNAANHSFKERMMERMK